jgi:hypothetical protein
MEAEYTWAVRGIALLSLAAVAAVAFVLADVATGGRLTAWLSPAGEVPCGCPEQAPDAG